MRQGQGAKRSRGRNGGRRNAPARLHNYDSNGPSVRIRGNAYQVHEKYLQLARDAASAGDRIVAENYFQHAEHYLRIINADLAENERNNNGQPHPQAPSGQPQQEQQANGQAQQGQSQNGRGRGRRGNGSEFGGQSEGMPRQPEGYGYEQGYDDGDDDRHTAHVDPGEAEQPVIEPQAMAAPRRPQREPVAGE